MKHSEFNILSDSQTIEIGTRHRHSIRLCRPVTRREVYAALKRVEGVSPTRAAAAVARIATDALSDAGLD